MPDQPLLRDSVAILVFPNSLTAKS
jgi:hypothetical protein